MKELYSSSKNFWNSRYNSRGYLNGLQTPSKFIKGISQELYKGSTLCLGSGQGRNAHYLASIGHDITAVDISDNAIEKSKYFAEQNNLQITHHIGNVLDYEIRRMSFDNIICCRLTLHLHEWKRLLIQISEGIKPTGRLVIEGFTNNHKEDENSFLYSWFYGLDPVFLIEALKGFRIDYRHIDREPELSNTSSSEALLSEYEYLTMLASKI